MNNSTAASSGYVDLTLRDEMIDRYYLYKRILLGPLTSGVVFIGIIGSLCSIRLLMHMSIDPSLRIYLTVLTCWDIVKMLIVLPFLSIRAYYHLLFKAPSQTLFRISTLTYAPANSAMVASIWMELIITYERYTAVSKPFKHRIISTVSRAQKWCSFISVLSIMYYVPLYFEVDVVEMSTPAGYNYTVLVDSEMRKNKYYQVIYRTAMHLLFITLGPFAIIFALTAKTMHTICTYSLEHTHLLEHSEKRPKKSHAIEKDTSKMLLVLVIKFLICYSLPTSLNIWELFLRKMPPMNFAWLYCIPLCNFLVVLNSATNWIVYYQWRDKIKNYRRKYTTAPYSLAPMSRSRKGTFIPTESDMFGRNGTIFVRLSAKPSASPSVLSEYVLHTTDEGTEGDAVEIKETRLGETEIHDPPPKPKLILSQSVSPVFQL